MSNGTWCQNENWGRESIHGAEKFVSVKTFFIYAMQKIPYSIKEYIRNAYTHISLWKKVKHREKKNRPMPLYLSLFTSSFIYNFSDVFIKLNKNLFKASV